MSTQDILFYLGMALIALGAVFGGSAAYLYFSYNIPDIIDDLSGKKRAEAIARMSEPGTGTLRRRKPKSNTPAAQPAAQVPGSQELRAAAEQAPTSVSAAMPAQAAPAPAAKPQPKPKTKAKAKFVPQLEDESDATSVISGEEEATTIITNEEDETAVEDVASDEKAAEVPVEEPKAEEPAIEEPPVEERVSAEPQTPEWFRIVQKIVLTESTDFVRVEQGEGHA